MQQMKCYTICDRDHIEYQVFIRIYIYIFIFISVRLVINADVMFLRSSRSYIKS